MEEPRDRVTISLYGTQDNVLSSIEAAKNEMANIANIKLNLYEAAKRTGRKPPEIVISVLLIPSWAKKSSYDDPTYKILKEYYLRELNLLLRKNPNLVDENDARIEDFYNKESLTSPEKNYLQFLEAKGSNADMIKTHAIICHENANRRHLQIDSNTQIFDFNDLYDETFGKNEQLDALNASYYDNNNRYVSAHNKIVYAAIYTTSNSGVAFTLRQTHLKYCDDHKDDHKDPSKSIEKKEKNSIYSKDFVVALEQRELTVSKEIDVGEKKKKKVYLALMTKPEYRITRCVATAVNMSWRLNNETLKELKQIPPIPIGQANCNYTCFLNAVLKHTDALSNHFFGEKNDLYDDSDDEAHEQLMAISNTEKEKELIKNYVLHIAQNHKTFLKDVIESFPNNPRGNALTLELFDCEVGELFTKLSLMDLNAATTSASITPRFK